MKPLNQLTIKEASEALAKGEVTSVDLTKACLEAAQKASSLNVFITLLDGKDGRADALMAAQLSDARRAKNNQSLSTLDGIPYVIKDSYCTEGVRTTAGSKMLDDFIPPYNAEVVDRLNKAGAILLGKTIMDQFGHGSSTENCAFGAAKNPWDTDRVPGGSSGGSAVAMAADLAIFAIGEDTGGSIRQPASFTNTTGLKVTYGRVSRYGSVAYASSLDTMGPMTKNAYDAAIVLEVIAGEDDKDATTARNSEHPVESYAKNTESFKDKLTIGLPKEFFDKGVDPAVSETVKAAADKMSELGHKVVEVSIPILKQGVAIYYIIAWAETSSNLARFDGIHYGSSVLKEKDSHVHSLFDVYAKSRAAGFSDETMRRIMLGTYVLSAGYYDAYYRKALKARTALVNGFNEAFTKVDVLLAPVSPVPPFKFGAKSDPVEMYMADIMTTPINPAGVPSLAIPAGFVSDDGKEIPIGMQLIGPHFSESRLLGLAHQWQKQDLTHTKKPSL